MGLRSRRKGAAAEREVVALARPAWLTLLVYSCAPMVGSGWRLQMPSSTCDYWPSFKANSQTSNEGLGAAKQGKQRQRPVREIKAGG